MEFKFEEKIDISISLDEVERLIENALDIAGYKSLSVEPEYDTRFENYGDYPFGESRAVRVLVGFKAVAKRV